ncbi:hypothetical protein CA11_52830 [Gimesia maris]|uniref:hypothetical protein n=1 Tax=Gimesia maris TaxID=122 RepID=UPI0011887913|nr:hypothetical protein [Gimesia maris]QDU17441.1 hypothetical protein CA11_52830 [Gimesia maris]
MQYRKTFPSIVLCFVAVTTCFGQNPIPSPKKHVNTDPFVAIPKETVLGTVFLVRPAWDQSIAKTVESVREAIRKERDKGKIVCYISTPLSSRGGGHRPTNVEISKFVKRYVESKYGVNHFWALAPGVVENELPMIEGNRPGGGEYLYMWTQILAGEDGLGSDFDMVYFVGLTEMHAFFGIGDGAILEGISAYIDERSTTDQEFKEQVAQNPINRKNFLRYYGIRGSATFSTGALDEWNIFRLANRRREIGDQVTFFFDGRQVSPAASETAVRPGYEQRSK